jgi:hypothetical protein
MRLSKFSDSHPPKNVSKRLEHTFMIMSALGFISMAGIYLFLI